MHKTQLELMLLLKEVGEEENLKGFENQSEKNEDRSPALQADSFPAESQEKPKNTGVGSLSLLQWIFPTQELNQGLLHCRWTDSLPAELSGKPIKTKFIIFFVINK